jgi:stage II sporulation protein D
MSKKYRLGAIFFIMMLQAAAQEAVKLPVDFSDIEKSFQYGIDQYYAGNIEGAMNVYRSILKIDDTYAPAYLEMAALYKELGRVKDAHKLYAQLYLSDTGNESYRKDYFISSVLTGDFAAARTLLPIDEKDARLVFYRALMAKDEKRYTEALADFDKALKLSDFMPEAYYFKGLIYYDIKRYDEAIEAFNACLREDGNFTTALYNLGLAYEKAGQPDRAISTLTRARSNLREDKRIQTALNRLIKNNPRDPKEIKTQQLARKERATPPVVKGFPKLAKDQEPVIVRIGIMENMRQVSLKAGGDYMLTAGNESYSGRAGDILFVKKEEGIIKIYDKNDKLLFSDAGPVGFAYDNNRYTTAVFDIMNGAGYFFAGSVDRNYRGSFEFLNRSKGITLVNIVEMEEYLYSVVPSEIPAAWPEEALKVQAVAARTYTLATMGTYKSRGFDLYGSITSHAYTGVNGEHQRTTDAVNATLGEVLYYDYGKKELLVTYYSANNGGYTEYGNVVWNGSRGGEHIAVPDAKYVKKRDNNIPLYELAEWVGSRPLTHSSWPKYHRPVAYRSVTWVPAGELALRVSRERNVGAVKALIARERGISGRAVVVEAVGDKGSAIITGDRIRSRAGGLRSNLYTLDIKLDAKGKAEYFIYYTAGWGHGVGMDQTGAAGMAADGYKYKEILRHYYPNGDLRQYKS